MKRNMHYFNNDIIANNDLQLVPNASLYEFGVLTSTMHNDWMRVVGGRMKSDYRYSATLVYNTFPWPSSTDEQCVEVAHLAEAILMAREGHIEKTLAELYDPTTMPDDLRATHKELDVAVERLYRSRPFRDSAERMEYLFDRYEKLIKLEDAKKMAEAATKKTRKPRVVKATAKVDPRTRTDLMAV